MSEDQKLTNAFFLMTKFSEKEGPLPEHEAMVYLQLCRWVEQTCKLQNLEMETKIRQLEGMDDI